MDIAARTDICVCKQGVVFRLVDVDVSQTEAIQKCIASDCCDTVRNRNVGQAGAISESRASD